VCVFNSISLKVAMHVHLNHGDDGVKRLFRRLHSMLRDHGKLVRTLGSCGGFDCCLPFARSLGLVVVVC
jgi:hypothetical protein